MSFIMSFEGALWLTILPLGRLKPIGWDHLLMLEIIGEKVATQGPRGHVWSPQGPSTALPTAGVDAWTPGENRWVLDVGNQNRLNGPWVLQGPGASLLHPTVRAAHVELRCLSRFIAGCTPGAMAARGSLGRAPCRQNCCFERWQPFWWRVLQHSTTRISFINGTLAFPSSSVCV